MTYLQGKRSYRRVDSVRRLNVGRMRVLNSPPAWLAVRHPSMAAASRRAISTAAHGPPQHAVKCQADGIQLKEQGLASVV